VNQVNEWRELKRGKRTMARTLREAAGSLLVVGLEGKELTEMERTWLRLIRPAGVILYRRNITDAKQTRALLSEATSFCLTHSPRFVDVEGGTVNRLSIALAPIPSAQAVATAMLLTGKKALAREHGELVARAVGAFGFNTSLAPMLDLALPDSAEVLGTRCPARSPADVVEYARGFLAGLKAHGIVGCGKHFPGLGGGTLDTHVETPAIDRDWQSMWGDDLAPYRELCSELPIVMMNHAAYPRTPGKKMPASVSTFWIGQVLRKRIGYRGIVLSDDLEMGGILKFMPIDEAAVAAIRTGSDLVEICHHPEPILRTYEALITEGERSRAFAELLLKRSQRTARLREKLFARSAPPALSVKQFEALRTRILRFNEQIEGIVPLEPQAAPKAPTLVETA
jgi:beta-N-acetylhexosaminidase